MAAPMTATQWLAQARKWKVPLNTSRHGGWARHNRNSAGAWGPVEGVVIHHTGSSAQLSIVDYCHRGDPERKLPGPLAFGVILDNGTCYMIGWGRCNTQGRGDGRVLAAMRANRQPPFPPGPDNTDGNAPFYGWEFAASGAKDRFTPAQFRTAVLISCAIMDFHGWRDPAARVIGHFQWTRRKTGDPDNTIGPDSSGESLDWPVFQRAVAAQLRAGPPGAPTPPPQEDDMPTTAEVVDALLKAKLGSSGPTVAVALQDGYRFGRDSLAGIKELVKLVADEGMSPAERKAFGDDIVARVEAALDRDPEDPGSPPNP